MPKTLHKAKTPEQPRPRKARPTAPLDWDTIEADYRAGIKTLRHLAAQHNLTHSAILNRAKRYGWTRNLRERVEERARVLLTEHVANNVRKGKGMVTPAKEAEVVEASARAIAEVIRGHRQHAGKALGIVQALFEELEAITLNRDVFERAYALLTADPVDGEPMGMDEKRDIMLMVKRAANLGNRAVTAKTLADALGKLVEIERTAFNIGQAVAPEPPPLGRSAHVIFEDFEAGAEALRLKFERRIEELTGKKAAPAPQVASQIQA